MVRAGRGGGGRRQPQPSESWLVVRDWSLWICSWRLLFAAGVGVTAMLLLRLMAGIEVAVDPELKSGIGLSSPQDYSSLNVRVGLGTPHEQDHDLMVRV
jgi:hypothetical protein